MDCCFALVAKLMGVPAIGENTASKGYIGAAPAAADISPAAVSKRVEEWKLRLSKISSEAVSKPTLLYFDIEGICMPIRLIFHVAGIDFDDVRIPAEDWLGFSHPFLAAKVGFEGFRPLVLYFKNGHIPRYVDQDVDLQESLVIMEYLGKKYYLFGDSFAEELLIKQVLLQAYDAIFHFDGIFPVNFGKLWKPKKYARKLQDDFMKNTFAEKMRIFSNYLKENPSGFMVGSRLSVADLAAYNLIANWYKVWDRGYFLKNFAHLDDYIKRIAAVPAVATYISTRQCPTVWLPNAWGAMLGFKNTTPGELDGIVPQASSK